MVMVAPGLSCPPATFSSPGICKPPFPTPSSFSAGFPQPPLLRNASFFSSESSCRTETQALPPSASSLSSSSCASSSAADGFLHGPFVEGDLERPAFTSDDPLSRFVSGLISIKPLYSLMRVGARSVFIRSAEERGIPWRKKTEQFLASDVYAEKELIENLLLVYPDYYLKEFHGYTDGNLCWQAAAEAEPATGSMVLRAIPAAKTLEEANEVLRGNWLTALVNHRRRHSAGLEVRDVLDIGCSVGISTRFLADKFPSAQVTGLDLSPYFLAVAKHLEKQWNAVGLAREKEIRWLHAKGEDTGLPSATFDVVSLAYVIHECPQHAIKALLKEAFRLLRPSGTVLITDTAPKSKRLQTLPPVLFTLMKSTEPWTDEYFSMDLEKAMRDLGFEHVASVLTDPRHRTVTGTVPAGTMGLEMATWPDTSAVR